MWLSKLAPPTCKTLSAPYQRGRDQTAATSARRAEASKAPRHGADLEDRVAVDADGEVAAREQRDGGRMQQDPVPGWMKQHLVSYAGPRCLPPWLFPSRAPRRWPASAALGEPRPSTGPRAPWPPIHLVLVLIPHAACLSERKHAPVQHVIQCIAKKPRIAPRHNLITSMRACQKAEERSVSVLLPSLAFLWRTVLLSSRCRREGGGALG